MTSYTVDEVLGMICDEYDSGGENDIDEDWSFPLPHSEDEGDVEMGEPSLLPLSPRPVSPSPPVSPTPLLHDRSRSQSPDPASSSSRGGRGNRERGRSASAVSELWVYPGMLQYAQRNVFRLHGLSQVDSRAF